MKTKIVTPEHDDIPTATRGADACCHGGALVTIAIDDNVVDGNSIGIVCDFEDRLPQRSAGSDEQFCSLGYPNRCGKNPQGVQGE